MSALHEPVRTPAGIAALRALEAWDIEPIIEFWYSSGDEFLDFLGIDRARLGTREMTRERFLRAIPTGDREQQSLALAITVEGALSGYTLLNRYTPEINYSHWHITNPGLRGAGLSTALYPNRIKTYFYLAPITRLIHQTRTRNAAVNRMLDRYVPVAETRYIDRPDGVAMPGEFHLRSVAAHDIPGFFERARTRNWLNGHEEQ